MSKLSFLRHSRLEPEGPIRDYFYIKNISDSFSASIRISKSGSPAQISLYYSYNGRKFISYDINTIITINAGDSVYFKGDNSTFSTSSTAYYYIDGVSTAGALAIGGNIMSLIDGTNFDTVNAKTEVPAYAFYAFTSYGLVSNHGVRIRNIDNLRLPAIKVNMYGYGRMFYCNPSIAASNTLVIPGTLLPATILGTGCYYQMFYNANIYEIPENLLSASTLADNCYEGMFGYNRIFTEIPSGLLSSATTLANGCYKGMFQNCRNLSTIPSKLLPAITATAGCYYQMFESCASLTTLPSKLMLATTMGSQSCLGMFNNTGVTSIPKGFLRATTLGLECYSSMFRNCRSLISIPRRLLPAKTTTNYCYKDMFKECTSLETIPANLILATTLREGSCQQMFDSSGITIIPPDFLKDVTTVNSVSCNGMFINCTSLISIPNNLLKADIAASSCYYSMFQGCTSLTTIPADLILATTYAANACTCMFKESGVVSVPANFIKAVVYSGNQACQLMFENCASLTNISEDMFEHFVNPDTGVNITPSASCFFGMFRGCTSLETLPSGLLKYLSLNQSCYSNMFEKCTSLTNTPDFPAPAAGVSSYKEMFLDCTSLTTLGDFYTKTFASTSCQGMFRGCTGLISVPLDWLPEDEVDGSQITYKVTLDNNCFQDMFNGCTSLTQAPSLNIYRLATNCYLQMFKGCTSLVNPPQMASVVTLAQYCYQYMFQNCTSLTTTPALNNNNTLMRGCYYGMFKGCCSLTVTPNLPSTALAQDCYNQMFMDCYKAEENNNPAKGLTTITANTNVGQANAKLYFTSCNSASCRDMFNGCKLLTNVPKIHIESFESGNPSSIAGHCSTMFANCESLISIELLIEAPVIAARALQGMFQNCKKLTSINNDLLLNVNITAFEDWACSQMFSGCYSLEDTIIFPINISFGQSNTSASHVFEGIYQDCYISADNNNGVEKGLVHISKNQGDTYPSFKGGDKTATYQNTFSGCKLLVDAPVIDCGGSNSRMGSNVCYEMFKDCISLESAPTQMIIAGKVNSGCCQSMFEGCTSLENAPHIPFIIELKYTSGPNTTIWIESACNMMFKGCTSLQHPPIFDINTGHICGVNTFTQMFMNCTSLEEVPEISFKVGGGFVCDQTFEECTSLTDATDFEFTGFYDINSWPVKQATSLFSKTFFGCTSLVTPMTFNISEQTQFTGFTTPNLPGFGGMFQNCSSLTETPDLENAPLYNCDSMFFHCTSLITIVGNPVFKGSGINCFNECSSLVDASSITFEGTKGSNMFNKCTSLKYPPSLPLTILTDDCYQAMFSMCSSLEEAPTLPATTLAVRCYNMMFLNCTSLRSAPELPATNLIQQCYTSMFSGCTSLTVAPDLPAEAAQYASYNSMFNRCTNLKYIYCMLSSPAYNYCTTNWVQGVNTGSLGLFKCKSGKETIWRSLGTNSGIPQGWTVQQV